jgi:signal transduction histidine kinase
MAFLVAMGVATYCVSRRWAGTQQALSRESNDLGRRLRDLEKELEDARTLGQMGERVARLSHGMKSAVHSLRGFVKLIEAPGSASHVQGQAIVGLRQAIDRLEEIARATLKPGSGSAGGDGAATRGTSAAELHRTLEEVIAQVGHSHAQVRFIKPPAERLRGIAVPSTIVREVLLVVAENAAEASEGAGEVTVQVDSDSAMLRLTVKDQGPGITDWIRDTMFRPGVSAKPNGHGFGLFLARRLLESRGGCLTATEATGGGAVFSVSLPLEGS